MIFFCRRLISYLWHLDIYTENIIFPCISLGRSSFIFCPKKKYHIFRGKDTIFPDNTRKTIFQGDFFWKYHLFGVFEENIIFPCIFWERSSFIFRPKYKVIFSGKRNIIFPDNRRRKIIYQYYFFVVEKTIFSEHLNKISYFHVFFWEGSSFMFRLNNKMIFSGKRNITFPGNMRKIIFQRDFFGKTIFSEHLEKENMVSRAVWLVKVAQ